MRAPRTVPLAVLRAYRRHLEAEGGAGLPRAMAAAFGDVARRWQANRLPIFDPAGGLLPALPSVRDPSALYEQIRPARKEAGAWYTPEPVVDWLVAQTLSAGFSSTLPVPPVLDPACGTGAFLLGVLRAVRPEERPRVATECLFGLDNDPLAVEIARARIASFAGLDAGGARRLCANLRPGDALAEAWPPTPLILTNPPFLNRLHEGTEVPPARAAAIRLRHGGAVGPYTDISTIFLLEARRTGATVGIVLPASLCATRDAAGARATVGSPNAVWTLPRNSFADVAVPMIAAIWPAGESGASPSLRFAGMPPQALDAATPDAGSWTSLLATEDEPPRLDLPAGPTLGDVATVHADFRDEYYAVRGHVAEGEQGPGRARIITSGSLDCGRVQWGVRRARIHGQDWLRPVAPIAALHPRQRDRLGPCVLVATQTRVIEAAAVPEGDAVGLTPVLTVIPKDSGGSWTIDALLGALLSPAATAWALRQCRGSGLTLDSIKLSATQLRALPLPPSPSHPEEFGLDGATRAALESWFARRRSR